MRTIASSLVWLGLTSQSLAFPALANAVADGLEKRQLQPFLPGPLTAPNIVPPSFNAKAQLIDVTGKYAYRAPGPSDVRGVCPGLNAMANHGYLPHNGVATIPQFVEGVNKVFGMGLDLGGFLAVYGAVISGDLTAFSIGGPTNQGLPLGLLTQPRGLNFAHNKYEYDASPTRGDIYLFGTNEGASQPEYFDQLYALQANVSDEEADYNLEQLTPFRYARNLHSRYNNPYFFNAPFAGVVLQPATYTFIWRLFANHSAEYPQGRLDKKTLQTFFGYEGGPGNWKHKRGQERIPENWYRRAIGDEYTIPFYAADAILAAKTYGIFAEVGGNLGKVNTFTGVDPSDLTKGVYNANNLLEGNNLMCYGFEIAAEQAPDFLFGVVTNIGNAIGILNAAMGKAIKDLGCPQLSGVNTGPLKEFPGFTKLQKDGTYPSRE